MKKIIFAAFIIVNGHKTLIFVSDNNFSKEQKTQFLLFEVN